MENLNKVMIMDAIDNKTPIKSRYMMATTAYHQLNNLSRKTPDLCHISAETDEYYIGMWKFGIGFFNVLFPKNTTRPLTEDEVEEYNGQRVAINSTPAGKIKIKEEV
jgi:hypothetical protein